MDHRACYGQLREDVKVGIEVPRSSYYNDERGFSCCMVGSGIRCRAVRERMAACTWGRQRDWSHRGAKADCVCRSRLLHRSRGVDDGGMSVAGQMVEPSERAEASFVCREGSRGATVEPIAIETDPGRPLSRGQGPGPLIG